MIPVVKNGAFGTGSLGAPTYPNIWAPAGPSSYFLEKPLLTCRPGRFLACNFASSFQSVFSLTSIGWNFGCFFIFLYILSTLFFFNFNSDAMVEIKPLISSVSSGTI